MAELRGLHELFESSTTRLRVQPLNLDHLSESWNLLEAMKKDVPGIEAKVKMSSRLPPSGLSLLTAAREGSK